jgi:phosphomevalonate kinase
MKAAAPGKLLFSGAYAVLEGAPAIVAAIDRYAVADAAQEDDDPPREIAAAFGDAAAPLVDVSALHHEGTKLGLGSSAAGLVAALGARALSRGASLEDPATRRALFDEARAAHARAQGGGSGVDVAASVHGGVLVYTMGGDPEPIALPEGLCFAVFWCGALARTSDMLARVHALREKNPARYGSCMAALSDAAQRWAECAREGSVNGVVRATQLAATALASLGAAADAPVVTEEFAAMHAQAMIEGAAFVPSGAGGGDVGVYLGAAPPSPGLIARAAELELQPLALQIDRAGLRAVL